MKTNPAGQSYMTMGKIRFPVTRKHGEAIVLVLPENSLDPDNRRFHFLVQPPILAQTIRGEDWFSRLETYNKIQRKVIAPMKSGPVRAGVSSACTVSVRHQ